MAIGIMALYSICDPFKVSTDKCFQEQNHPLRETSHFGVTECNPQIGVYNCWKLSDVVTKPGAAPHCLGLMGKYGPFQF